MRLFTLTIALAVALLANISCGGKACGDYTDAVSCAAYACTWNGSVCQSTPGTPGTPGNPY